MYVPICKLILLCKSTLCECQYRLFSRVGIDSNVETPYLEANIMRCPVCGEDELYNSTVAHVPDRDRFRKESSYPEEEKANFEEMLRKLTDQLNLTGNQVRQQTRSTPQTPIEDRTYEIGILGLKVR